MEVSTGLIRNRETWIQILKGGRDEILDIAQWENGDVILSLFVQNGGGVLLANGETRFKLAAGCHMLCRVRASTALRIAVADDDFLGFVFLFSEAYLCRHCPEKLPIVPRPLNRLGAEAVQFLAYPGPRLADLELRRLVGQIYELGVGDADLQDPFAPVYRDIKVAELIVFQLKELIDKRRVDRPHDQQLGPQSSPLKEHELRRVYRVRDLLRTRPGDAYTLRGLAHRVGTNDATLKKHFKHVFGHTVFGYLRICRMEYAKQWLIHDQFSVAEIAQKLGYRHVSHFSAAFRKFYGCTPTRMRSRPEI